MRTFFLVGKLDNGFRLVYVNNLINLTISSESGRLIIHLKLAIYIGQWLTISIFMNKYFYVNFPLEMLLRLRRILLECPLYNFIRERFLFLFKNVILGSFKSFSNWTIKSILASTLPRPLHFIIVGN